MELALPDTRATPRFFHRASAIENRSMKNILLLSFVVAGWLGSSAVARDLHFDGSMPEEVLRSYLSRSMTTMYLLSRGDTFEENLRMLHHCGVKFAGRAVYQW